MKCPICKGTGENRDAMQAWDIPGAPVPECYKCKGTGEVFIVLNDDEINWTWQDMADELAFYSIMDLEELIYMLGVVIESKRIERTVSDKEEEED